MNAKQLKSLINIGLIVAFIGVLISFPFKEQYVVGGLLFALCSASLIGGLADSFAVKAIFGQPLKIRWPEWIGTNIIARQRKRLEHELVQMVQYELLSPHAIGLALGHNKISTILINFLNSETGQQSVKQLLNDAIQEAVKSKRIAVVLLGLKRLLGQISLQAQPSRHLVTIINYIFQQRIDDTIAAFLVRMMTPLLTQKEIKQAVNQLIQAAINKYEKDNRRRQVANQIANIDSEKLTEKLFTYAQDWLFEFISSDHPTRMKIKQSSLAFIANIEDNPEYAAQVDTKCQSLLQAFFSSTLNGKKLVVWIEQIEYAISSKDEEHLAYKWSQALVEGIEKKLSSFSFVAYEKQLLQWLMNFIESKQDYIGKLVKEKLDEYTTEELIELVEDKAGRDLQFIRLNGAVVGGLIGASLFLIQLALGGAL